MDDNVKTPTVVGSISSSGEWSMGPSTTLTKRLPEHRTTLSGLKGFWLFRGLVKQCSPKRVRLQRGWSVGEVQSASVVNHRAVSKGSSV